MNDNMLPFVLVSLVFTCWLVSWPLATHYIMWRNRHVRRIVPPGITLRPYMPDQRGVALRIAAVIYTLALLITIALHLETAHSVSTWRAAFAGTADTIEATGVGGMSALALLATAMLVALVRWLQQHRPAVVWVTPDSEEPRGLTRPRPLTQRPGRRVID